MPEQKTHAYITCADPRIDIPVATEIATIRNQGGILEDRNIVRLPGGVHLLSIQPGCREVLYNMIGGYHQLFGIDVIHYRPHTNCKFCGMHAQHKLGNGTMSDLAFHVKSAKKLLAGAEAHFSRFSQDARPTIDTRIVLTTDQMVVTIEEADALVHKIPEDTPHGACCFVHSEHRVGHLAGNGHDIHPPMMTGLL